MVLQRPYRKCFREGEIPFGYAFGDFPLPYLMNYSYICILLFTHFLGYYRIFN